MSIIKNAIIDIFLLIRNFPLLFKKPSKSHTSNGYQWIYNHTQVEKIEYEEYSQRFWQIILPSKSSLKSGSKEYGVKYNKEYVCVGHPSPKPKTIYINGMLTSMKKAQRDAQYVSAVFGRDVHGIYNPTRGFIVDLFESMFGRTFNMRTSITRDSYRIITRAINNLSEGERLLLIGHSQGGIIINSVVEMMVRKMGKVNASRLLSNVDIITFGSGDNGSMYDALGVPHKTKSRFNICQVRNKYDFVANLTPIKMINTHTQFVMEYKGHDIIPHYLGQLIGKACTTGVPDLVNKYIKFDKRNKK